MANVTLTDTSANFDDAACLALLNGEDITLNNANLTIDSDVRWGQNAAFIGNITISSTLGGSVLVDGRTVWWIPYTTGAGNVPALGTRGVQNCTGGTSSATGEFLGVWSAIPGAPATAGGAMPATGWIKFRSKVGNFVNGETISLPGGASIVVNSATGGRRGWIHLVGEETSTITVPRLGLFQTRGDWFELGTTNGADDQTFTFPVADNCPAIQIETAAGSGVYEWYLNAGGRWGTATQFVPTDARGKYFGMDNATGVITIARRATNACGFKPVTGCRVRIPNIIVSSSTTAAPTVNALNATLATRWDFTTTSAGDIDIEHTSGNWYLSLTSAYRVKIKDSSILQSFAISNTADTTTLDNVALGLNSTTEFSPVTLSNLFTGGSMTDCRFVRYASSATGQFAISMTDCVDFTLTRVQAEIFGSTTAVTRGNATVYTALLTRVNDTDLVDCTFIGSRLEATQCARISATGTRYADQINGATGTTNPQYAVILGNATTNVDINGFSNFASLANVHPHSGILSATNAFFVSMRNIGTAAAPYNMGSANASGLIANAAVATDLTFRRIYTQNTRTSPFAFVNTVQRVTCVNVWGDGADSQAIAALSITPQGCRWTNSVTGQASVYGRHWEDAFTSTTAGRILISCNEALADTADQVEITSGTPAFTSGGQIAMRTLGDQVTWTMPYYCLGYTSLANIAPTITGTNTGNFSFEYQIDTGSGFSAWKALTGANLSGETISPTAGFKLKVRATVTVANSTNALTYIRIDGVTNSSAQQTQYPLPFDAFGVIAGLQSGSRVQIYNVTDDAEIYNEVVAATSLSYGYYEGTGITAGDTVRVRVTRVNGATAYLPYEVQTVATATGFSVLAAQQSDAVYNTNAIDGSTVTDYVEDYPNVQIDIDDADGSTTAARLYAWFANTLTTEDGIREWFGGIVAEDSGNYKIVTSVLNLKLDNIRATGVLFTGEARLYRDDGAIPVVNSTTGGGSIVLYAGKVYTVETGTSGLTTGEAATLAKIDTLTEDVGGLRFTTKALEQAPSGGGGSSDWTATERNQIRHRLGIDGTAASPTATPSLATPAAVRTELSTELGRIDTSVSSRLASASYVAPANADISAIKAKTDNLPSDPADESSIQAAIAAIPAAPSASTVASAVRTELTTELGRIDASVSSRLASAGYTAPANSDIAAIKAKTDNLPSSPASETTVAARPTLAQIEASSVLAKEATVTNKASQSSVDAVKANTDLIPAAL